MDESLQSDSKIVSTEEELLVVKANLAEVIDELCYAETQIEQKDDEIGRLQSELQKHTDVQDQFLKAIGALTTYTGALERTLASTGGTEPSSEGTMTGRSLLARAAPHLLAVLERQNNTNTISNQQQSPSLPADRQEQQLEGGTPARSRLVHVLETTTRSLANLLADMSTTTAAHDDASPSPPPLKSNEHHEGEQLLEQLRERCAALEGERDGLAAQLTAKDADRERMIGVLEDRNRELGERVQSVKGEAERLQRAARECCEQLSACQAERDGWRERCGAAQDRADRCDAEKTALAKRLDEATAKCATLDAERLGLLGALRDAHSDRAKLQGTVQSVTADHDRAVLRLEDAERQRSEWEGERDHFVRSMHALAEEHERNLALLIAENTEYGRECDRLRASAALAQLQQRQRQQEAEERHGGDDEESRGGVTVVAPSNAFEDGDVGDGSGMTVEEAQAHIAVLTASVEELRDALDRKSAECDALLLQLQRQQLAVADSAQGLQCVAFRTAVAVEGGEEGTVPQRVLVREGDTLCVDAPPAEESAERARGSDDEHIQLTDALCGAEDALRQCQGQCEELRGVLEGVVAERDQLAAMCNELRGSLELAISQCDECSKDADHMRELVSESAAERDCLVAQHSGQLNRLNEELDSVRHAQCEAEAERYRLVTERQEHLAHIDMAAMALQASHDEQVALFALLDSLALATPSLPEAEGRKEGEAEISGEIQEHDAEGKGSGEESDKEMTIVGRATGIVNNATHALELLQRKSADLESHVQALTAEHKEWEGQRDMLVQEAERAKQEAEAARQDCVNALQGVEGELIACREERLRLSESHSLAEARLASIRTSLHDFAQSCGITLPSQQQQQENVADGSGSTGIESLLESVYIVLGDFEAVVMYVVEQGSVVNTRRSGETILRTRAEHLAQQNRELQAMVQSLSVELTDAKATSSGSVQPPTSYEQRKQQQRVEELEGQVAALTDAVSQRDSEIHTLCERLTELAQEKESKKAQHQGPHVEWRRVLDSCVGEYGASPEAVSVLEDIAISHSGDGGKGSEWEWRDVAALLALHILAAAPPTQLQSTLPTAGSHQQDSIPPLQPQRGDAQKQVAESSSGDVSKVSERVKWLGKQVERHAARSQAFHEDLSGVKEDVSQVLALTQMVMSILQSTDGLTFASQGGPSLWHQELLLSLVAKLTQICQGLSAHGRLADGELRCRMLADAHRAVSERCGRVEAECEVLKRECAKADVALLDCERRSAQLTRERNRAELEAAKREELVVELRRGLEVAQTEAELNQSKLDHFHRQYMALKAKFERVVDDRTQNAPSAGLVGQSSARPLSASSAVKKQSAR